MYWPAFRPVRIDCRDAIALAYLSQLLLNSIRALDGQDEAEREAEEICYSSRFLLQGLGGSRGGKPAEQRRTESASPACPDSGRTASKDPENERRAS
jgi:hypothetical protein